MHKQQGNMKNFDATIYLQNFQAHGLQIDLRGLDKIELLKTNRSTTGWAMKVGPGVTWDKVTIKALNA